tara:strand:+ start:244 stop:1461 length:1218 start_codon:yes stop_codon:yes gene_type:complete
MATWTKVVVESTAGKIAQESATATSIGNLTGEVTSSNRATTIANNVVDEANLKVSNAPTDGYILTARSAATGDMTWEAPPTGDVTGVTAGTGLTGGGASGALTLNVVGGTGITANADDIAITAGGVGTTQLANDSVTEDKLADALLAEIDANTAKVTNVSTNLGLTGAAGARTITSSDGNNVVLPLRGEGGVSGTNSGLMEHSDFAAIALNTAKETNVVQTTVSGNAGTVTNGVYTTSTIAVNKGGTGATATTGSGNNVLSASPTFTGTIDAAAITTSGNLTVGGTLISTETEILKVEDSMIIVNAGVGTGSTAFDGGIMVERGDNVTGTQGLVKTAGDNVGIMWDDSEGYFRFSSGPSDTALTAQAYLAQASNNTGTTPTDVNSGPIGSIHVKTGDESVYVRTA